MTMTIGDRIRQIRGKKSRADFAAVLGIHPQTLYMYEKDKRVVDVDLLQQICLKCDVSVEWLVFGDEGARGADGSQNEELEEMLHKKELQLVEQDAYIKALKDELITAQAEAIKAYEIAMGTLRGAAAQDSAGTTLDENSDRRELGGNL